MAIFLCFHSPCLKSETWFISLKIQLLMKRYFACEMLLLPFYMYGIHYAVPSSTLFVWSVDQWHFWWPQKALHWRRFTDLVTVMLCICAGGDSGHHFRGGESVTLRGTAPKALHALFVMKMRRRAKGSKTGNVTSYRNRMPRKEERRTRSKVMQCWVLCTAVVSTFQCALIFWVYVIFILPS
jgi:hypothetical protein